MPVSHFNVGGRQVWPETLRPQSQEEDCTPLAMSVPGPACLVYFNKKLFQTLLLPVTTE